MKHFIGGFALGTLLFAAATAKENIKANDWAAISAVVGVLVGMICWGILP